MPDAVLCYFFFKDSPDQNNICAALCALIHQILSRYPELSDFVVDDITKNGTGLISKERTLWRISRILRTETRRRGMSYAFLTLWMSAKKLIG